MMFLFFFGPELEHRVGGKRFLLIYFISGLVAALGYSFWTLFVLQTNGSAIGASGALFGIFACLGDSCPGYRCLCLFYPDENNLCIDIFRAA